MFTWPQGIAFKNLSHKAYGTGLASRLAGPAGRSISKAVIQIGSKLPLTPKAAALGVSLVFSALLTAAALRSPDHHWLAWISFLPLFVVVQSFGYAVPSKGGGQNRPARTCRCGVPHSSRSEGWGTDGSAKRFRLANPSPTPCLARNGAPNRFPPVGRVRGTTRVPLPTAGEGTWLLFR